MATAPGPGAAALTTAAATRSPRRGTGELIKNLTTDPSDSGDLSDLIDSSFSSDSSNLSDSLEQITYVSFPRSSSSHGYEKNPKSKGWCRAGKTGTKDKRSRAKSSTSAKTGETLEVTPWVTRVMLKHRTIVNNNNGKIARKPKDCPCSPPLIRQTPKDAPRMAISPNM